jgi:hypothetical protein
MRSQMAQMAFVELPDRPGLVGTRMDEILIGFFRDQAEGMRALAMREDNEKRRQLILAIADTYRLLQEQFVELGNIPGATQANPNDETEAH